MVRHRIANPNHAGSTPVTHSNLLPLKPLTDEVLSCKQGKSVRFRTGAPNNATLADVVIAAV
jgi:hypothetical protein